MALAGFILALYLFGFIGSYSLHSILETNRNALIYDGLSLQNSKGIGINLTSSSRNHVLVKHFSRRPRGFRVGKYTSNIFYFLNILLLLVSNDVQQNPGPTSGSNALRISSFSARSIVNKRLDLQAYVTLVNPDFIAITETWLHNNIDDNELLPNSYNIHRKDRESRGGGVILAVRSNISCFRRRDLEESDCELLWGEIPFKDSSSYFVGVFYRPPSSDLTYLEGLARSLDKVSLISEHANILLLGDFNLPDIDWDLISPLQPNSLSDYFCDYILNFFSLSQLINQPTRLDAVLDLVISNRPENISNIKIGDGLGSSDHNIITFDLQCKITRPCQPSKQIYDYQNANWDNFRLELSHVSWDTILNDDVSIDCVWNNWKRVFFKAVHNNIQTRAIKSKRNVPWITSEIRKLFHKRKRLWKKAKSTQLESDWNKYKVLRNKVKSELGKSYYRHVHLLVESKNPKRFWSFIKSKTKNKSIPLTMKWNDRVIKASSSKEKAELFNNFFSVDAQSFHLHTDNVIADLVCSGANVEKLLLGLNTNKATGPDGVTARLLREAAPSISSSLSCLFNMSLKKGKLPCDWKRANVTPVYKKGEKELVTNYRPISLTSLVAKTMEKLVTNHILSYLEDHTLLSPHRYGFRAGLSCTSQLIHLFHAWASALDKGKTSDVVFLDFEKAFDSVPHLHLYLKLKQYGIRGQILEWLSDFLLEQYQRVVLEGESSKWTKVSSGVPQGSIVGPILFLLYVNDIPENLSCASEMFADDTLLFNSGNPSDVSSPIQDSLSQISDWCNEWLLRINPVKCESMRITRSKTPSLCSYNINSTSLNQVHTHKHLGVILSSDLSWKMHGLLKRTFG